jgi:hypothetical protein
MSEPTANKVPTPTATMTPARDALGTDQQTALLVLRRVRKRMAGEMERVQVSIERLESLCVHDYQPGPRVGPYESFVCTRCGAEQLAS